ncbi:TonB-dependent receptor plug domain-containing protein [Sediminibacterium sp.]|uniref:TonB-dependent receptor plug domain-containing protein n=1 Tax=Sediminibacterium sp. TaxID=1917865 RepID=UPI003F695B70
MSKKLTLFLTLLSGANLYAQKDSLRTNVLDEVVVTANKQEQKQSTTGKVITVIGPAELSRSAGKSLGQVLNETVGLTINGALNNAGTNQTVFMRGANSGRTLILMDGIPVYDPSQIGNEFDLNLFSINDVERIEVCRGAQSTVYGSDAVAGVINIITVKQNVNKPVNVKATLTGGNLNSFKSNLQVYGKWKKLSYTLRNASINTNGFSTAADTLGNRDYDRDGYHGNTTTAALQYAVSEKLLLKGYGMYSQYRAGIDAGVFSDDKHYQLNNNLLNTGWGAVYKTKGFQLTANYQYSETNRGYERDSLDKRVFSYFQRNQYFGKTQFAELYANIKINQHLSLLQGVEYRYASMNNQFRSVSSFGPFSSGFADTSTHQTSVYSSLQYSGMKGFFADAGFRLNKHSIYGNSTTFTFNPSYAVNEQLRIFGSVATAFKTPSLFQLFDTFSGRRDLKAETSTGIEIGMSHQYNGFSSRLVGFYRNTNNGIDYDYVRNKYYNFIKQVALGVEYETNVQLSKSMQLKMNFTYLSMTDSTQSRVNFKDTGYVYGLRRPGFQSNVVLQYNQPKWTVSISGKYVGSRSDIGGFRRADVLLPAYFLLGAYAEYRQNEKLKIFIDTQNITNNRFTDLRGFNGIPFMVNSGISVQL